MFGAWDRDPGHWEAVLPKNRSTDLFRRLLGFLRRFWGGGLDHGRKRKQDAQLISVMCLRVHRVQMSVVDGSVPQGQPSRGSTQTVMWLSGCFGHVYISFASAA